MEFLDQLLKWLAFLSVPSIIFYAGMRFERWDRGRMRVRARRAWAALLGRAMAEDPVPPLLFETMEEVTIPAGTKVEVTVRRIE